MRQGSEQDLRDNVGRDTYLCLSESNDPTIQPSGRTHFKPSESHAKETRVIAHHIRPPACPIYRLVILVHPGQYVILPVKRLSGPCRSLLPRTV